MRLLSLFAALLVLSMNATALDLNEYPQPFISGGSFAGQIVVGGDNAPATDVLAATEIAVSLQQKALRKITASTESEFANVTNSILIGLPCQNSAVAYALGTSSCDIGLEQGNGFIRLMEKDGKTFLVVTGKTAADTRKAARVIAKHSNYSLSGNEVMVTGTLDNPLVKKAERPLEISKEVASTASTGCVKDDDCNDDKWCMAGKCTALGCPEGAEAKNHDCIEAKKAVEPEPEAEPENTKERPETKNAEATNTVQEQPQKEQEKPGFFSRIFDFFKSLFR